MISESFIAPLYTLHVDDLGPEHAVCLRCLCGAGPWHLHGFWLRQRYRPTEFLRWIVEGLPCPRCGTRGNLSWSIVKASFDG